VGCAQRCRKAAATWRVTSFATLTRSYNRGPRTANREAQTANPPAAAHSLDSASVTLTLRVAPLRQMVSVALSPGWSFSSATIMSSKVATGSSSMATITSPGTMPLSARV
jgi:hypothetical protein